MVIDPRYYGNRKFLSEAEWDKAKEGVINFLTKEEGGTTANDNDVDPHDVMDRLHSFEDENDSTDSITNAWDLLPNKSINPNDNEKLAKKDLVEAEFKYFRTRTGESNDPFDFYKKQCSVLPQLSKAAAHYLLASSSSVESERFFSGATSLYQNKSRNKLSGDRAEKLLFIKGTNKAAEAHTDAVTEIEESEDDEPDIVFDDYDVHDIC